MAQPWNTLATHSGIDGATHKSKGAGCHALFWGVKIQKVGAIYTRTLEESGAIYSEGGVYPLAINHGVLKITHLISSVIFPAN